MRMHKTFAATVLAVQFVVLSPLNAAEPETGFGAYENADLQTRFIACDQAIYERDWFVYEQGILKKGGLNSEQALAAFATTQENTIRMLFFSALAKYAYSDDYHAKLKQVRDANYAMYVKDEDAAVKEYKRLGDFCLYNVYPAVVASSPKVAEIDKGLRNIQIPEDVMKAAKAEFMAKAMKAPTE